MNQTITQVEELPFLKTNLDKTIKFASPSFFEKFIVSEKDVLGKSIHLIIEASQSRTKRSVIFGKIFGQSCLIKKKKDHDDFVYYVLTDEHEVDVNEIVSFLNSIESNKQFKRTALQTNYQFGDIIGDSPAINRVKELAAKIAISNSTVLLTGESGTGKELFAQAIHNLSARRNSPFVAVNCVAIPDELFESELFGYEPGAFSGARKGGKPGKFELAQNGTLFLDEISELSYVSQGKLLRVLQEREVERLGGTTKKKVDIRIIAATNKDLSELVKKGKFRQDLFYRLYVFDLNIPPLRKRRDDIIPLAHAFIKEYNQKFGKYVTYIDSNLEKWLLDYEWPGNVRELRASIERGMNIVEGDTLTLDTLYFNSKGKTDGGEKLQLPLEFESLEEAVQHTEIRAIKQALKEAEGDRVLAAQKLKIHVASLYRKISKYNLKD